MLASTRACSFMICDKRDGEEKEEEGTCVEMLRDTLGFVGVRLLRAGVRSTARQLTHNTRLQRFRISWCLVLTFDWISRGVGGGRVGGVGE